MSIQETNSRKKWPIAVAVLAVVLVCMFLFSDDSMKNMIGIVLYAVGWVYLVVSVLMLLIAKGSRGRLFALSFVGSAASMTISGYMLKESYFYISSYYENSLFRILGYVFLLLFILHNFWLVLKGRHSSRKDKILAFYDECVQNKIFSLDSQKDIERAKLFAQKRKLTFTDISELYQQGQEMRNKNNEIKSNELFDSRKKEEQAQCAELEKYSKYTGREKLIAMLTDQRNAELAAVKSIQNGSNALINSTQQKEQSWAVHGGIASGLAGPAAGVATAMDIQNKNAAIRAQNAANLKSVQPALTIMNNAENVRRKRAEAISQEIDVAKTKLVSDESPEVCMSHIVFSDTQVAISETGTCTVTTNARMESPMIIFDDVQAVVDGTITAQIFDKDTMIGTALLVLPCYGLNCSNSKLTGMSLFCGKQDLEYTVKFEANKLWALESRYTFSQKNSVDHDQENTTINEKGLKGKTDRETNENVKARILEILRKSGEKMRVSEIIEADADLVELKNHPIVSSCANTLVDEGVVEKTVEKRISYFQVKK